MRIVALAKQIPETPARVHPDTGALLRDGPTVLDPADLVGVEAALRLVEAVGEGEVVLVSMAPSQETAGLRTGLAMGAARAVVVSDDVLTGSDALGTAKVLAAAVRVVGPDLVVAGTESTDGSTGVVPVQVAELLGWPAITFARTLALETRSVSAERHAGSGRQEVHCVLPCVVTVTGAAGEARYPSFRGIVDARRKPVEALTTDDLGLSAAEVGWAGAGQAVVDLTTRPRRRVAGEIVDDDGRAEERILAFLAGLGVV